MRFNPTGLNIGAMLAYLNPEEIRIADYQEKEDQGILYVDHAGEILYRLADG